MAALAAAPVVQNGPAMQASDIPAYHKEVPTGELPRTLLPSQFQDVRVQNAYAMAAKVKPVLYQQPCYCHCDKEVGHHSLLDCFAGDHASICETCLLEGIYAYQQTQSGKTPAQIRAAIIHGDWKTVNINEYLTPRKY